MKKMLLKVVMIVTVCLLTCQCSIAATYTTHGDGRNTVIFYVESFGTAKLTFSQNPGECQELTCNILNIIDGILGRCEEWGKYHIEVTKPNGYTYNENWDKTYRGGSFELTLNGTGYYTIKVTPYSNYEMTKSWRIDQFAGWTKQPYWWIGSQSNCNIYTSSPTPKAGHVNIYCYDQNGSQIYSERRTVSVSGYIDPPSISGYTATSGSRYITLNNSGDCDPSYADFYYKEKTITPPPTVYPPAIEPYDWDTKFRTGVSAKNPNAYQQLYKLTDGDPNTVFTYVLYNSDKNNGLPDFTAYFNNGTVRGIKIRNGDAGNYYHYMRINLFHVVVYANGSSYVESVMTVPDSLKIDYYSFAFGKSYQNVSRIEIYIDDRNMGEGEERNVVRIRDIAFY